MENRPKSKKNPIPPRLIIHGGAGNILPSNLPPAQYREFHHSLLSIVARTQQYLLSGHSALDVVSFAVTHLENNPLFNSGHGAVFTRDGINELEVSAMVSSGKKKRGVGLMGLRHVKNPILLAREMLVRGEKDLEGGNGEHRGPILERLTGGAQGHCQLFGEGAERLAREWGLEIVPTEYFFVQKRWDEHVKGLEREKGGKIATWDADEFVSQGTCGAVCLDSEGVAAVATSTGGLTNKLTGRVGDTPTLGAGFWAEEWEEEIKCTGRAQFDVLGAMRDVVADCLPGFGGFRYSFLDGEAEETLKPVNKRTRAIAISGTGNGDSFLRTNAARTASAIARYRSGTSLSQGVAEITGPGGELEKSAGDRWKKTGEGEGGMIGIECTIVRGNDGEIKETASDIIVNYNCGGMFRALITRDGKAVSQIWRDGECDGLDGYEEEGKAYDPREWLEEKMIPQNVESVLADS